MKNFNKIIFLLLAVLTLVSCEKDKTIGNIDITPVLNVFLPEDNVSVKLVPTTSASVQFEWEQSKSADNGVVLYELVFIKEGGDFSSPVYKMLSDNSGLYNRATVSHKVLNTIASLAGIEPLSTGKLKWTIIASRGINEKQSEVIRTIELERPAGFAEIPTDLYLTGAASEGGEELINAAQFKQTANGVFEIYSSLKNGNYHFVDSKVGTPVHFSVVGTAIRVDGETAHEGEKVYRIVADFNNAAVSFTEIKKVELWFAPDNAIKFALPYAGNGQFIGANQKIDFKQESWGRDERYKFRFTINEGGNDSSEWWGSSNNDNSRPGDNTAASFWHMFKINNNDQWNYCFKFKTEVDGATSDFIIKMNAGGAYTHEIVVK